MYYDYPDDDYDDGLPPWDQPGAEEWDGHTCFEELEEEDDWSNSTYRLPEPIVGGHPNILIIGEPFDGGGPWGGTPESATSKLVGSRIDAWYERLRAAGT